MKILIDNGHGSDTPGKRSPDGKFLEYQYNRIIATRVVSELVDCGYDAELLVPEEISLHPAYLADLSRSYILWIWEGVRISRNLK